MNKIASPFLCKERKGEAKAAVTMGSGRALLLLTGHSPLPPQLLSLSATTIPSVSPLQLLRFTHYNSHLKLRTWSSKATKSDNGSSLPPPDVPRLAETARISLTPQEAEEFAPKIRQVIDWFGQLQAVDLDSVEPALRADTEGDNLRDDVPETFEKREAIISSIPSYEEPYIKVPQVLNKE